MFGFEPDPDNAGWFRSTRGETGRFNDIFGRVHAKIEGPSIARLRLFPERRHLNILQNVHGGFIMAVIDQMMFLGPIMLGVERTLGGQTINLSTQFFGPLKADSPIDTVVEVMRVTGRLVFTRGVVEQDGETAVSFNGTIRKASTRG